MNKANATFNTTCDECGKPYQAKRSTSKYCSSKCRTRAHRSMPNQVHLHNEAGRAQEALDLLMKISPDDLLKEAVTIERLMTKIIEFQAHYLSGVQDI